MNTPDFHAVIFGATSAIATEAARAMVAEKTNASLLLVGRDPAKLEAVANDLRARKAEVRTAVADFTDPATDWKTMLQGPVEVILVAHGELTDQEACLVDGGKFARTVAVNFTSAAAIAGTAAGFLASQGHGTLAVIGSVAGDRGRQSNFLYGSTKAALDTFLEGLRHLHAAKREVKIVTIKPGLIDTPMTADIKKGPLCSPADVAGRLTWKAIKKGRPVAYIPGFWRVIMTIIRAVPRVVFYKTKL